MDDTIQRLREYQEVLRNIVSAFKNVPFPVIVESAVGYEVLPFEKDTNQELLEDLSSLVYSLLVVHYNEFVTRETYKRLYMKEPKQFRVNEVSGVLERELVNAQFTRKTIQEVKHLASGGYPDFVMLDKQGRTLYMDLKTTTRPAVASPRDFSLPGSRKH